MAKNLFHKRTKHIQIRPPRALKRVEDEVITRACRTSEMLADSFTKPLLEQFERLRIGIGLS